MKRLSFTILGLLLAAFLQAGCVEGLVVPADGENAPVDSSADALVARTVSTAETIAEQIGTNGFGGHHMGGYREHFGPMMGFNSPGDLADSNGFVRIHLHNQTDTACTFRLAWLSSNDDFSEQFMDVTADPGEQVDTELPCAEFIGLGSVNQVGSTACLAAGGQAFGNDYCVPAVLHADYACNGDYDCFFGPDEDDIDGDGDTTEPVATTQAFQAHFGDEGVMGHHHGAGDAMGNMPHHNQSVLSGMNMSNHHGSE